MVAKSLTRLFTNGIITIHDFRKEDTSILMLTISQGDNTGTLGLYTSKEELVELRAMLDEYFMVEDAKSS